MDGQQVKNWESRCIEESPPACTAACPVHLDVRGMVELVRKDDFKAAHALFSRFIQFPGIVGHLCDHPCEGACKRNEAGTSIRIHELERTCVNSGFAAPTFRVNKQLARKRIAVVGAGLSGLTAAADLTVKGHAVVVFEAEPEVLARLRGYDPQLLPPAAIAADLARFDGTGIEFRCNATTDIAALADEFDAIYLGLGAAPQPGLGNILNLAADGRIAIDPHTYATSHPKIFAGGSQRYGAEYSIIASLQDGRYAALSIDRLLQGASLTANRDNQGAQPTRLYVNTKRHAPLQAIAAADTAQGCYTQAEAVAEAARCFPCHCLECVQVCPYLEHYGAYPKRYIREIYNNETIVMGARKSNRMIDSCTLCGLCAAVCPEQLGMGEVCLSARQGMVEKNRMPVSHHDFALRDMAFSQSDAFSLARHQPGHPTSTMVFFPGCQLAASAPDHVEQVYAHLCAKIEGGVGLMLGCCGAPAEWAAREDLFANNLAALTAQWESLGRPVIVTACSTCFRTLRDKQSDMSVESLWTLLERIGLPQPSASPKRTYAIHDPCTTRHDEPVQASVRRLLAAIGVETTELNAPGLTTCCGFGGLVSFANPEVANKIVDKRIRQCDSDYLTYCAMCRDNFARRGKRALHILDLILDTSPDAASRADPGFSHRQENRARLKSRLLREVWGENVNDKIDDPELLVSDEVRADMERRLILEDDVRQVVRHAETSGAKLIDPSTGYFIASHRPAAITYWVEYTVEDGRYVIHRAYSHRMQVG